MNPFPIDLDVVIAPNDPNIWDIATAVGTVATVAVALVLGLVEQRRASTRQRAELDRLERERNDAVAARQRADQAAQRREFEAQARAVSVWFEERSDPRATLTAPRKWEHLPLESVEVANHSEAPIFDVQPGYVTQQSVRIDVGEPMRMIDRGGRGGRVVPDQDEHSDEPRLAMVRFRDASGTTWVRYSSGHLSYEHQPISEEFFDLKA